jgi:hypothetical protein
MHTEGLLTDPFETGYAKKRNLIVDRVQHPDGVHVASLILDLRRCRSADRDFTPRVVRFRVDASAVGSGLGREAGPDEMITFLFGQLFIHL